MPAYNLSTDVNIGTIARSYIGIKAGGDGLAHGSRSAGDEESEIPPSRVFKDSPLPSSVFACPAICVWFWETISI